MIDLFKTVYDCSPVLLLLLGLHTPATVKHSEKTLIAFGQSDDRL